MSGKADIVGAGFKPALSALHSTNFSAENKKRTTYGVRFSEVPIESPFLAIAGTIKNIWGPHLSFPPVAARLPPFQFTSPPS